MVFAVGSLRLAEGKTLGVRIEETEEEGKRLTSGQRNTDDL